MFCNETASPVPPIPIHVMERHTRSIISCGKSPHKIWVKCSCSALNRKVQPVVLHSHRYNKTATVMSFLAKVYACMLGPIIYPLGSSWSTRFSLCILFHATHVHYVHAQIHLITLLLIQWITSHIKCCDGKPEVNCFKRTETVFPLHNHSTSKDFPNKH